MVHRLLRIARSIATLCQFSSYRRSRTFQYRDLTMAKTPKIPLPKSWPEHVKSAMLQIISLAQFATAHARGWAADSANARVRLKARVEQLEQKVACLREEMRIKDVRMASITPHKRPHYAPTERLAILELRASRCWNLQQTADAFQVTPATIASWTKRAMSKALTLFCGSVNRSISFRNSSVTRFADSRRSAHRWAR